MAGSEAGHDERLARCHYTLKYLRLDPIGLLLGGSGIVLHQLDLA
jgi:hypothetical protein